MKHLTSIVFSTILFLIAFGVSENISAQMANPLESDPSVWNSKELFVIWGQAGEDNQDISVKQAIFGVDYIQYLQAGTSPFQEVVAEQTTSLSVLNPGVRPMAVVAGDYKNI